jgi:hypothetical protein
MKCPNGAETEGHVLLPKDPYSRTLSYSCAAAGCDANLSHRGAEQHTSEVKAACEALRTPFRAQRFKEGCRVAKAVEAKARDVLA